ncbi:NADP-dependent 3-hydroxy acid dehydrogenase YdfG [Fontimonas thermophila]|uniref:NADP-dependent 3-hydroxy acid dehydrogenase YdfG n=1 Tax=Fontimonas thermophila TaxID=1076937 RepID=A0A1I2H2C5_9GAMM|nr:SDR family NAD(P)-dependent oxidoreductase [Fontimonas thermophila]SFF24404.1 NADP-dependent 3-hydroxy acid dehydrogenase YdfG [Fontimonas thermophila]
MQTMQTLSGKVVVVTGAFGHLGAAVAHLAATRGARVAMVDRAPQPPPDPPAAAFAQGGVDLSDADAARVVMTAIAAQLGAIDALVNVAGTFRWETIEAGSAETWDALYRINLRSALCATQAALPHLLRRPAGRIVNVGAHAAARAGLGMGAYAASKSGVARLTEALSEELKDRGITVNAVLPGIIDTPQNRRDMPDADPTRWVAPSAIAEVIGFLLTDAAAAVTGALIPVTGRL